MTDVGHSQSIRAELGDELLAVVRAREELSPEHETFLVQGFLDRLDAEIDARIEAKVSARRTPSDRSDVLPVVLGVGVPLSAIAVIFAGVHGLLLTWVALTVITAISVVGSHWR